MKAFHILLVVTIVLFISASIALLARAMNPINSQGELDTALIKEAAKLGIKGNSISAVLSDSNGLSGVMELGDGYRIIMRSSLLPANLTTLRHELYHAHDNHVGDILKEKNPLIRGMKYFIHEIEAEAYSVLGLKL